jgi:hypothetical protein
MYASVATGAPNGPRPASQAQRFNGLDAAEVHVLQSSSAEKFSAGVGPRRRVARAHPRGRRRARRRARPPAPARAHARPRGCARLTRPRVSARAPERARARPRAHAPRAPTPKRARPRPRARGVARVWCLCVWCQTGELSAAIRASSSSLDNSLAGASSALRDASLRNAPASSRSVLAALARAEAGALSSRQIACRVSVASSTGSLTPSSPLFAGRFGALEFAR